MVFIDTHIAIWLYNGNTQMLSAKGKRALETSDIRVTPMVKLEIEYLYEIGKIKKGPDEILSALSDSIDLRIDDIPLTDLVETAIGEKWTRDPFDRMIVGHAKKRNAVLISADHNIAKHYKKTMI
ncbi:MAG TPA: PIN domain-containing protein [Spirochaetota bacterium]|nr:PIN domain-containing protein [Spirochaetota bacterium]OPZ34445.1 MAG: PIN domain protein [Spirochaetes bacterium ADurb.BinA120]HPI15711.1 PIN domain-containing protein [Spirochaetota bacterium]HPO46271.1 PIN domain-containing protein [Spirochaetota bacterium]